MSESCLLSGNAAGVRHLYLNRISRLLSDKQQELDLPTFKVEDADAKSSVHVQNEAASGSKDKSQPMSLISGVRKLQHGNSFSGSVPKYGVETPHREELALVSVIA